MRIRKRPVPLPFSSLYPTTPPDPQPHKLPSSSEKRRKPDSKARPDAAEVEQRKDAAKAEGSQSRPEEERTHLDDDQLHTCTLTNPSSPLQPPKLEENHRPQPRPSSDLQLTIIRVKDGWICSDGVACRGGEEQKKTRHESCCICPSTPTQTHHGLQAEEETKGKEWRVLINNSRNATSLGAETAGEIWAHGVLSSSSNEGFGRWCEGEKAFPLKKRRGCFDNKASEDRTTADKEMKMRSIVKIRSFEKWVQSADGGDDDGEEGEGEGKERLKKIRNRGVVMEGSRCSRVNGRGWRCCQTTLVGYSLCEHHLGKGRLRNMNTVRARGSAIAKLKKPRWSLSSSVKNDDEEKLLEEEEEEEEEEGKPLMREKKRKKIGMVKARSISVLLGQTENGTSAVNSNNGGIK